MNNTKQKSALLRERIFVLAVPNHLDATIIFGISFVLEQQAKE